MVYLIPGYTTPSQPGRHSGGAKPLGASAFLVLWTGTLFRSEFWNTILITFILVISFTSWWLKWHYTLFLFMLDIFKKDWTAYVQYIHATIPTLLNGEYACSAGQWW